MIEPTDGGVLLTVRVIPRAAKAGLAGTRDCALLVRLTAPPVDDAANEQLVDVLARACNVARRAVTIVSGAHSRTKRVKIAGIDADTARQVLGVP